MDQGLCAVVHSSVGDENGGGLEDAVSPSIAFYIVQLNAYSA